MIELLKELFRYRRYKASQGNLIRRLTMAGVWVLFATAAWKCTQMDFTWFTGWCTWVAGWNAQLDAARAADAAETIAALNAKIAAFSKSTFIVAFPYLVAGVILLFGLWFGYRLVHWTTFADFLISIEGEMAKVSWPGKTELWSSTIVVLTVFLCLAGIIYVFDLMWAFLLKVTGVV